MINKKFIGIKHVERNYMNAFPKMADQSY